MKKIIVVLTLIFLNCCTTPQNDNLKQAEKVKPNVLFILADDLGYGDLTCYNPASKVPTPNLDKLAQDGVRFTDVHTPSSVCTPTRYGLLTGRYAWRTRLKHKVLWPYAQPLIADDRKTLPDLFKEQGYHTAMFGKWHLGWGWAVEDSASYPWEKRIDGNWGGKGIDLSQKIKSGPNGAGFDYAFGVDFPNSPPYAFIENGQVVGGVPTEKKPKDMFGTGGVMRSGWKHEDVLPGIIEKTKVYLDTVSQPFFVYLPLTAPHTPIMPSKGFEGKSGAGDYGDFICELDAYVGQIMELLRKRGKLEETLIIFTSDNGSPAKAGDPYKRGKEFDRFGEVERRYAHYPNAPLNGYKAGLFEGGHRVPFIASWKGQLPAGETSNMLFGLQDMMATFHAYFNVPLQEDEGEDSYDVSPYLFENRQDTVIRDHIIMHGGAGTFAIRKDGWKFFADSSSGGTSFKYREMLGTYVSNQPGQLYHLEKDVGEQADLYKSHPEKVQALTRLLIDFIDNGRSTQGEHQANDKYLKDWKQVNYIRENFNENEN